MVTGNTGSQCLTQQMFTSPVCQATYDGSVSICVTAKSSQASVSPGEENTENCGPASPYFSPKVTPITSTHISGAKAFHAATAKCRGLCLEIEESKTSR